VPQECISCRWALADSVVWLTGMGEWSWELPPGCYSNQCCWAHSPAVAIPGLVPLLVHVTVAPRDAACAANITIQGHVKHASMQCIIEPAIKGAAQGVPAHGTVPIPHSSCSSCCHVSASSVVVWCLVMHWKVCRVHHDPPHFTHLAACMGCVPPHLSHGASARLLPLP
jgi:hypothetical protein